MKSSLASITLLFSAVLCVPSSQSADSILVESRKADGTANTPVWTEVSGKWGNSKNKSRVPDATTFAATNVFACVTNQPAPAFQIVPVLASGTTYKVETTFGGTASHAGASDLIVAVTADGMAACTLPANTPAFQGGGADSWVSLGTITPSTNRPVLTFKYVSGTLSRESRWYADAIRFTPEAAPKTAE